MIEAAARELNIEPPIWHFTIGMLRASASSNVNLKVKAAEARQLLPICRFILAHWCPLDNPHNILRLHCVEALCRCYAEVDTWAPDSGERLGKCGRQFVALYCELRRSATDDWRWKLSPKFHLFIHLCEKGENPRDTWNYWDESEIGKCADIAETVHPSRLAVGIIAKYRAFEFSGDK